MPTTEAQRQANQRYKAKRAALLSLDPGVVEHGSEDTYQNWGCRCEACKAGNAARALERRQERKLRLEADPTLTEHGKESTYVNWLCRCGDCTAAMSRKRHAAGPGQRH